jgi:alpha-amylase/alpha-mannosidase (GH57 family)
MPDSAFCIHGHFYQPPREDPLTGVIPKEEGAYPYENWNERILAQCYKPNAELGNYSRISFNLGPTVLEWMSKADPETLASIIDQERKNFENSGLPNGMAQSFNHTILPLASRRDKQTQIIWGMQEFKTRFGHAAEGIWLPEAAVDSETLSVAAECGVKYVILAPWQCKSKGSDLAQPGWVELGQGKRMAVFFYNQGLSTRVSFDPGATRNADEFLEKAVLPEFSNGMGTPKDKYLIIASDGELYGHHQRFRDQFLAQLTTNSLKGKPVEQVTPAAWLRKHPPTQKIEIVEKSSWSCHHGILRWCDDCGCTPNSKWKAPLRSALNHIAEIVDSVYEEVIGTTRADPFAMRDNYIKVLLKQITLEEFILNYLPTGCSKEAQQQAAYLLKAQYERQRMFTSCGWFFDDFDRIEPRNNVKYAAQAVWLTQQVKPNLILGDIVKELHTVTSARSNLKADQVFQKHIENAQSAWSDGLSRA